MAANHSQGANSGSLHNLDDYATNENNAAYSTTESYSAGALHDNSGLIGNGHASALFDNDNAGDFPHNSDFTDNDHASAPSDNDNAGAMPGITGDVSNSTNIAQFSSGGFQDVKLSDSMEISDREWNALKKSTAVESCLSVYTDKDVAFALQYIKGQKGIIPEDIKGKDIAWIINEIEGKEEKENNPGAFIADKGHQDGKAHEVEIHYICERCDTQGVKPVLKLVQGPTFL